MSCLKRAWSDPVWSKVLANTIWVGLAGAATYSVLHWWPSVKNPLHWVISFLGAKTPVWNWLIGAVSVPLIVVVILVIAAAAAARREAKHGAPPVSYAADVFFGVRWRWRYVGGDIANLHCLCLNCGMQIYFVDIGAFAAIPHLQAGCEECGRRSEEFDGNYDMLENHVIRLIQRNLRDRAGEATA
jgi:hypothetical protein